ncbi:MAG: YdgA family protein, partial [Gammaproteobacteria bacterium]|nr:YdgA family protein [Gammaproteobacteria bacterium]
MRKSIIILLVIAAIVVLLSPGIIGRIAEESVESNLQWAADENQGIVVTAERFDRGWFSSEGRHRIGIQDPAMQGALAILAGREPGDGDASLVI